MNSERQKKFFQQEGENVPAIPAVKKHPTNELSNVISPRSNQYQSSHSGVSIEKSTAKPKGKLKFGKTSKVKSKVNMHELQIKYQEEMKQRNQQDNSNTEEQRGKEAVTPVVEEEKKEEKVQVISSKLKNFESPVEIKKEEPKIEIKKTEPIEKPQPEKIQTHKSEIKQQLIMNNDEEEKLNASMYSGKSNKIIDKSNFSVNSIIKPGLGASSAKGSRSGRSEKQAPASI